jgi:hypothetical protein
MDVDVTAQPRPPALGDWVVTLDVEDTPGASLNGDLAVRALGPVVAGSRTYLAPRSSGYSFTVIGGALDPQDALGTALHWLGRAQREAGLEPGPVVCAEVTLVGTRPVPAGTPAQRACENPGS